MISSGGNDGGAGGSGSVPSRSTLCSSEGAGVSGPCASCPRIIPSLTVTAKSTTHADKEFITGLDAPHPEDAASTFRPVKLTANAKNLGSIALDATAAPSATIYRFVSEHKQAKRYFVSGNVQGVGYRYFTQRAAERLQLKGYTRNLPDGSVEVYAIGTPDQLARLRSALERGPWGASVSEVREENATIDSKYAFNFVITY